MAQKDNLEGKMGQRKMISEFFFQYFFYYPCHVWIMFLGYLYQNSKIDPSWFSLMCNLAHIFVSGTHENIVHYKQDKSLRYTGKESFQFLRLVESHYENLPFLTDVFYVDIYVGTLWLWGRVPHEASLAIQGDPLNTVLCQWGSTLNVAHTKYFCRLFR